MPAGLAVPESELEPVDCPVGETSPISLIKLRSELQGLIFVYAQHKSTTLIPASINQAIKCGREIQ